MRKERVLAWLVFLFMEGAAIAQSVSGVEVSQEGNNIIVDYSLQTDASEEILLYISLNGGKTFQGPLTKVKGDVGKGTPSGRKRMVWNVLEEYSELVGDEIVMMVEIREYQQVTIGNQVWMSSNLNVNQFRNGDPIPEAKTDAEWLKAGQKKQPVWCYYNNDPANGAKYGKLYNWYAVNDPRGLAPEGWHIPSDAEWTLLINFLGGEKIAGGKMKNTSGWDSKGNGTNSVGFTGLPGGLRIRLGAFYDLGKYGGCWSSTEIYTNYAWCRYLFYSFGLVYRYNFYKGIGLSVRCLRD